MPLFKEINSESKLRLTVTYLAMNTLYEDQEAFSMGTATIINKIITNYHSQAASTISVRLDQYHKQLLSDLGSDQSSVIQTLLDAQEKRLRNAIPVYSGDMQTFLFRINKENLFLLTEDASSHEERYYPKGIKAYIQALVEEFARLPFIEREKIYFIDIYNALNSAMEHRHAVYLFHSYGKKYLSKIFAIKSDPLSMYTYIIAKNINSDTPGGGGRIYSYRLSRIDKVLEKPNISGDFSNEEQDAIRSDIARMGVQFVGDDMRTVVVRFTDQGIKDLNSQIHLRPHITKIWDDQHTYEFECTKIQAFFYFRKLGSGSEILEPASLAKKIYKWHQDAAAVYKP